MGLTVRCCLGDPHEPLGSNIGLPVPQRCGDETNAPSRESGLTVSGPVRFDPMAVETGAANDF